MKGCIAGIVVFLAGLSLYGQGNGFAGLLPSGFWPEGRTVTEMQVVHDLDGGIYVPYIADGAFRVLKMGKGEEPRLYAPEGFNGTHVSARNLKVIPGGPEQYTSFIGKKDGKEGIYIFGITHGGEFSCYFAGKTGTAASISDYSPGRAPGAEVLVCFLAEGRLNLLIGPGLDDRPWAVREISSRDEPVDAFQGPCGGDGGISYGWYRSFHEDQWEITLFSLGDRGFLAREKTGGSSVIPRTDYRVSPDGIPVFTLIRDAGAAVYYGKGGVFIKSQVFTAPVRVSQYMCSLGTGAPAGLLIGHEGEAEFIYAVTHEGSGSPVLKLLYSLSEGELLDIFFVGDKRISLLFRQGEIWHNALVDLDGVLIKEGPLQIPGKPVRILYASRDTKPELYVLCNTSGMTARSNVRTAGLVLCRFEAGDWIVLRDLTAHAALPGLDWYPAEISALNPFYAGTKIMPFVSTDILAFLQTESGEFHLLENQRFTWSIRLNGVMYLAAWSGNSIQVYRMGE